MTLLPKRMLLDAVEVRPVPPRVPERVPKVSDRRMPKDEVANGIQVLPVPAIKSEDEAKEVSPVPPRVPPKVPVVFARSMFKEEVANWSQVLLAPPIKREEEAMVVSPVPP